MPGGDVRAQRASGLEGLRALVRPDALRARRSHDPPAPGAHLDAGLPELLPGARKWIALRRQVGGVTFAGPGASNGAGDEAGERIGSGVSDIARAVRMAATMEWNDPASLSNAVAASVPEHAREGFVVLADFSGVCLLDPRGVFRVFGHDGGSELERLDPSILRSARLRLSETHPKLAQLLVDSGHPMPG